MGIQDLYDWWWLLLAVFQFVFPWKNAGTTWGTEGQRSHLMMQHSDRRFFAWISWSLELETPSKIHDSQKSIYQLMHSVLKCRELWIIYVYNWRFLKLKLILAFDIQVHCFRNLELPTRDQPGVWPLFWQVGEAIQSAAGKTLSQRWFYPLGPINDLVPCTAMYLEILEMFGRALSILFYLVCVLIWAF